MHAASPATATWVGEHHPELEQGASLEGVLADPSIDAIVVATPIETHAEIAAAALHAGKHVFVEKPLATSAEEASALGAAALAVDRVLFVGHQYLYHPLLARLRYETAGEASFLGLDWRKYGTFDSDLFWNLGSHEVSLALALMGTPTDVELLAAQAVVSSCDIAVLRLSFPEGRSALVSIDRASPARDKLVTAVSEGRRLLWHGTELLELDAQGEATLLASDTSDPLTLELEAFAAALEGRAAFPSDAAHAVEVARVLEQARAALSEVPR